MTVTNVDTFSASYQVRRISFWQTKVIIEHWKTKAEIEKEEEKLKRNT